MAPSAGLPAAWPPELSGLHVSVQISVDTDTRMLTISGQRQEGMTPEEQQAQTAEVSRQKLSTLDLCPVSLAKACHCLCCRNSMNQHASLRAS